MPRFAPEPPVRTDVASAAAVVLINLGTPESPTAPAVRRYLKEFLSDPRVVEIPKLLWWPILNGVILNRRPKQSAAKYAAVWQPEGSPLRLHSARQAKLLQGFLGARGYPVTVVCAMRYGQPALGRVLDGLKAEGVGRVLLLPMYPQYAASTTATALDAACHWLLKTRRQPEIRTVRDFHDHPGYLAALEQAVRKHWQQNGPLGDDGRLLISFHGLPKRSVDLGDPYFDQCQTTGRLLAERLQLPPQQFLISFQSRFGQAAWLQPYTAPTLRDWGRQGVRRVDALCPGFVADCLETLEEIAIEGRREFLDAGGKTYHYIPALNENEDWLRALADLAEQHLAGWLTAAPRRATPP
ncbi:MAG: ferrochelatase [Azonexus sp.]|jgi:ferrochelatase|nr:ferrochelatase [Azonexus sp.]